MSEKKTIQINPELFKFSDKNTTRKKQSKTDAPRIKVRSEEKKFKQKSLRKNVLKMIREKQQEEYKRLFDKSSPKKTTGDICCDHKDFNTDFNESLEFFSSLAKNKEEKEDQINHTNNNATLKKYPNETINSMLLLPNSPIEKNDNEKLPESFFTPIHSEPVNLSRLNNLLPPPPKYSCMKNSSLPTYRNWCRQTQRVQPSIADINTYKGPNLIHSQNPAFQQPTIQPPISLQSDLQSTLQPMNNYENQHPIYATNNSNNISEIVQKYEKTKSL